MREGVAVLCVVGIHVSFLLGYNVTSASGVHISCRRSKYIRVA
jgi:hypothetical protein